MSKTFANRKTVHTKPNAVDWIAGALAIFGAVNWGLVGFVGLDPVALLFGPMSRAARVVYVVVALAAALCTLRAFARERSRR